MAHPDVSSFDRCPRDRLDCRLPLSNASYVIIINRIFSVTVLDRAFTEDLPLLKLQQQKAKKHKA